MFRPALPSGFDAVTSENRFLPPAAMMSSRDILDRSSVVLRFGRMALPTCNEIPVSRFPGSDPLSGENGGPDWRVRNPLTSHPPNNSPRIPWLLRINGTSMMPFNAKRCGRSYVDRPRSACLLNESCATATSPELEGLKISETSSMNVLHV